jgi:agmatine deiminase
MPAEWAPQSGTLMVWPDFESLGDEELLRACRSEVLNISNTIARFQPVTIFTKHRNTAIVKASVSDNVTILGLFASHLWVRDTGPVFIKNAADGSPAGVVLNFNYWGTNLTWQDDQDVAQSILSKWDVPKVTAPFRAEGGAIEVDGEGTLLATESSILNMNRNPGMSRVQLEEGLGRVLGIEKVLWLPGVKGHDITDYHIDGFARFVSPGVVLLGKPAEAAARVLVKAYREAKTILGHATDAKGRRLRVVEIVEPDVRLIPGRRSWTGLRMPRMSTTWWLMEG